MLAEVFGDYDWRYTPPETRTHLPHLKGFDPQSAPRETEWPPRVLETWEQLLDLSSNGAGKWVNLPPYHPSLIPMLNESTTGGNTTILFVNLSGTEVLVYRVHLDGTENYVYRSSPNPRNIYEFPIGVGRLLLVKDLDGKNLAVFQAVEKVGRALVAPTLHLIKPGLSKISGDNQTGVSGAILTNPFVVEAQDANGSALAGVSVTFAVIAGGGALSTTSTTTDGNGRAQSRLTLGPNQGTNTVEVSAAGIQGKVTFHAVADTESPSITADVNGDGVVNLLDLIFVGYILENEVPDLTADVNGDGVVSIQDLVLVASMFGNTVAAPPASAQAPETLTAVEVQGWLTDARSLEVRDPIIKRGIMVLEQLLVSLTPKETELLANYPNPFNPETWIPYRLAEDAFVTLTIYDQTGQVVRKFEVGHRIASAYESRSKAIYWDGRNGLGEQVASGVYFYHLSAGDFSATRRMLILK